MAEKDFKKQTEDLPDTKIEDREEWQFDGLLPSYQPKIWPLWMPIAVYCFAIFVSSLATLLRSLAVAEIAVQLIGMLLQDSVWFILPIVIVCIALKHPASSLGLVKPPLKIALLGMLAGIVFYLLNTITAMIVELIAPGKIGSSESVTSLFDMTANSFELFCLILLVCLIGPAAEEMLFRAFFYPPLLKHLKRPLAIIVCGAIFAAIHFSLWTFLPLFVGGIGFAWLYDKYRNLWVNIIAHASWNIVVVILIFAIG